MIGKAVYGILSADGAVSGFIGTKIYPNRAPQQAKYPLIVYGIVTNDPIDSKDAPTFDSFTRVSIDVYGETYTNVADIADAVKTALDRYSGTVNTIVVDQIYFEDENDLDIDEDLDLYRRNLDFKFHLK